MTQTPSYMGLGAPNQLGKIVSTADNTISFDDAFRTLIVLGGTNGSTFLIPAFDVEVGTWWEFYVVNDAVTAATRFGAATSNMDVILADSTGRFVAAGSTEEGSQLVRLICIGPERYAVGIFQGEVAVSPAVVSS